MDMIRFHPSFDWNTVYEAEDPDKVFVPTQGLFIIGK
jgi:hypothetical protein